MPPDPPAPPVAADPAGDQPSRVRRHRAPRDPELPLPAAFPVHPHPPEPPAPAPRRFRAAVEYGPPVDLFTPRTTPAAPPVAPPSVPLPPSPPASAPPSAPPSPTEEAPPSIAVQRVSPDSLVGTASRPDPYLYLITERAEAEQMLRHGLFPDAAEPPRLLERRGVPSALAALEEDGTGTTGLALLRVRRLAVEELIEDDPDRAGAARGFLLSGRGGPG